jgi:hypothetical protein
VRDEHLGAAAVIDRELDREQQLEEVKGERITGDDRPRPQRRGRHANGRLHELRHDRARDRERDPRRQRAQHSCDRRRNSHRSIAIAMIGVTMAAGFESIASASMTVASA